MIRLLILLISFGITFNSLAQSAKIYDHNTYKELVKAEKYIPGFVKDSVKTCFPIYRVLIKKEYRSMKFEAVPKYMRIEKYLDFDHATLDEVMAPHQIGTTYYGANIRGRHLNCVMQHDSKLAFEEC